MCISSRMHSFTTDIPMYENAERSERWTWKHALNEAKAEYAWDEEPSKAWYNRRSIDRHKAGVAFGGDGHGRLSASPAWTFGWPVWKVRCHWKLVFAWQVFLDLSSDSEDRGRGKFRKVQTAILRLKGLEVPFRSVLKTYLRFGRVLQCSGS